MWSIMNLFFGGPPEESLKRQVGEKASGPDVSEKTGSRHNEKYEQDITAPVSYTHLTLPTSQSV